jgi:hypothetical protein
VLAVSVTSLVLFPRHYDIVVFLQSTMELETSFAWDAIRRCALPFTVTSLPVVSVILVMTCLSIRGFMIVNSLVQAA